MSVYVFLGPSLPLPDARRLLDATYLPPVVMGDVYAVSTRSPQAIVIIDGLFERTPAVWHKEILYALSCGIRVFGGSSMGALRAAELSAFGMVGIGRIFEGYREGAFHSDDEVAVVHGAADTGYRALSDAMVNLRYGLLRAEELGLISTATRLSLEAAGRRRFYPERAWGALYKDAEVLGLPSGEIAALRAMVAREAPNQKQDDAVELLRRVAVERASGWDPLTPAFDFEPTWFWSAMIEKEAEGRQKALFGDGEQTAAGP